MTREIVIGILSLILWSLILIVTIKYVVILLRADNKGEGGTLTLVALAQRALGHGGRGRMVLLLGIVGAGLFYGDAVITPAISVLSAVEGLKLATPGLRPPTSCRSPSPILVGALRGPEPRHRQGRGLLRPGHAALVRHPRAHRRSGTSPTIRACCAAINPAYAVDVLRPPSRRRRSRSWARSASSVTGAEALYADLGHFGRGPIRIAWLGFVFPALVLNYFGQGALVLANPAAIEHPFFRLAPDWALLPVVVLLATLATIIASQAVITGAFSLTRQAIQLGLLPRLEIRFTSESHQGQIYLPRVNTLLLAGVILLVLAFQSSSNLAHAYGISVFGAMAVDALLAIIVIRQGLALERSPLTLADHAAASCSSTSPSSAPTC